MKKTLQKFGIALTILVALSLAIDTGSAVPPKNALVYLNKDKTIYFAPTRTPDNQGYIPTSYIKAKQIGAKPDIETGFNVDGPSLLMSALVKFGVLSSWPSYWAGTKVPVEYYE